MDCILVFATKIQIENHFWSDNKQFGKIYCHGYAEILVTINFFVKYLLKK